MDTIRTHPIARATGAALLLMIVIGILSSVLVTDGININLSADAQETLARMRAEVDRVYARAHISTGLAALELLVAAGLYRLVRSHAPMLGLWSLLASVLAVVMSLATIVATLAIAHSLDSETLTNTLDPDQFESLLTLFVITDYSAFHLGMVLSATGKAGFFWLLARARLVAAPIAWWGLAVSLYVASMLVGRDFLPALGASAITMSFILCNLIAQLALGSYLAVRGVRGDPASTSDAR